MQTSLFPGKRMAGGLGHGFVALMILAGLTVGTAKAGFVTLDSQSRRVLLTSAGTGFSTFPQTVQQTAPDFGPFDGLVQITDFVVPPDTFALVEQMSSISVEPDLLTIQDSAGAITSGFQNTSLLPYRSDFDIHFTLSTPARFTGSYSNGAQQGPSALFAGPGAPGALAAPSDPSVVTTQFSGTLQPGQFDIRADLDNVPGDLMGAVFLRVEIRPAAVPLPPTALAVLTAFPLLAAMARRSTRGG